MTQECWESDGQLFPYIGCRTRQNGPFHWDGHQNGVQAVSSSSVSRFCFFILTGSVSAWQPQFHRTDIASLTSPGPEDPSSARLLATPQMFSAFQPTEGRTDGKAPARNQETKY